MSVLGRLLGIEERADAYPPVSIPPPSGGTWVDGMVWHNFPGSTAVTTDSAMRLSAVFACLRLLSEAIATLPVDTFVRVDGTRSPWRPRPKYLSFDPPQGSRINYLSQVMLSLLTDGNAFIATPRDELGVPLDLVVLDPGRITIDRVPVAGPDGRRRGTRIRYRVDSTEDLDPRWDLMHIPGMTLPGQLRGLSPIGYARETIGLGLAAQGFGRSFFENGALPGAVIEAPNGMSDDAIKRWKATWNGSHQGVGNANRVGVLTEGAKLNKVSIQPDDAQFLETRQFQVPDVARIFGVPPHLIADASNSTSWGSGLAEQNLAFGQFSLRPWMERVEEAHTRLLTTHGLTDVFVKLNLDALLRASLKDRYEAYEIGIRNEFLEIDEARATEDLPPKGPRTDTMSPRQLAEAIQKIYLGVGKVITSEEAREILNREGAALTGPAPSGGA